MIQVMVSVKNAVISSIVVSGHAYSGEPGFDLVCAGVSSIMTGALNALDELAENVDLSLTEEPRIEIKNYDDKNQVLLEFVMIQLKTIEFVHPEYIRIREKEVTS